MTQGDTSPGTHGSAVFVETPAMSHVREMIRRAAKSRSAVLICGERGTGRELVARTLHAAGPEPQAPFVSIDCARTTPQELEQELFGTTTAQRRDGVERRANERIASAGRLHNARGGTLFLEHITEMPARVQARLLRVIRDREALVLEDRGVRRLVDLDVRPVAAVEPSVDGAVREGRLRRDLYERLAVSRIDVPALRQRREDIPVLAEHFLGEICAAMALPARKLASPAAALLAALPWPGNVRELREVLARLAAMGVESEIPLEDLLAHVTLDGGLAPAAPNVTLREARVRFEREYVTAVLKQHQGKVGEAAKVLGIQRTNLYRKVRQLKVEKPSSR